MCALMEDHTEPVMYRVHGTMCSVRKVRRHQAPGGAWAAWLLLSMALAGGIITLPLNPPSRPASLGRLLVQLWWPRSASIPGQPTLPT